MSFSLLKSYLKIAPFGILESQHLRPYGDLFVKYGGESDSEVQDRIVTTCTELMHRSSGQTVLAVTHANACLQFIKRWDDQLELSSIPNGAIFGQIMFHHVALNTMFVP